MLSFPLSFPAQDIPLPSPQVFSSHVYKFWTLLCPPCYYVCLCHWFNRGSKEQHRRKSLIWLMLLGGSGRGFCPPVLEQNTMVTGVSCTVILTSEWTRSRERPRQKKGGTRYPQGLYPPPITYFFQRLLPPKCSKNSKSSKKTLTFSILRGL